MDENILRFPGFIVSADRKKVFKDGNVAPMLTVLPRLAEETPHDHCKLQRQGGHRQDCKVGGELRSPRSTLANHAHQLLRGPLGGGTPRHHAGAVQPLLLAGFVPAWATANSDAGTEEGAHEADGVNVEEPHDRARFYKRESPRNRPRNSLALKVPKKGFCAENHKAFPAEPITQCTHLKSLFF
jgi:hypothetical protein